MKVLEQDSFITCEVNEGERQRVCSFWTPEQIAKAGPENMYVDKKGLIFSVESVQPSYDADTSTAPFCSCGKLLYTRNGKAYAASAQFMERSTIVLTAAHCVMGVDNEWATNMAFYQAYNDGKYGQVVPVKSMSIRKEWKQPNRDFAYDYALMVMEKESTGGHLDYEAFGQAQTVTAVGYPGNIKEGRVMQKVTSAVAMTNLSGIVAMLETPFKGGASGGAWIRDCGHTSHVVGLNSFITEENENVMFGPLLDEKFDALVQYVGRL